MKYIFVIFVNAILCINLIYAQGESTNGTLDNVHLFQTFLRDASTSATPYGEAGLTYNSFDFANSFMLGVQGGFPVNPQLEIGGRLGFKNWSPDQGDGQSGLSDLTAIGKYNIVSNTSKISAGGYVTLPIGEEKVGEGNLNFGGFGAIRHPLNNGMVITGVAGLDFIETTKTTYNQSTNQFDEKTEYDTSILLGGGAIYPVNELLNVIGELNIWTEGDYVLLTGAVDYIVIPNGRVRGGLGLGLDNGAPDVQIKASFLMNLK